MHDLVCEVTEAMDIWSYVHTGSHLAYFFSNYVFNEVSQTWTENDDKFYTHILLIQIVTIHFQPSETIIGTNLLSFNFFDKSSENDSRDNTVVVIFNFKWS